MESLTTKESVNFVEFGTGKISHFKEVVCLGGYTVTSLTWHVLSV